MNLINWICTAIVGGSLYRCEEAEEYEIYEKEPLEGAVSGYYVRRLVAECDDIGPVATFQEAEDALMKFLGMLVAFEEQAWRVLAAETMRADLQPGSRMELGPDGMNLVSRDGKQSTYIGVVKE